MMSRLRPWTRLAAGLTAGLLVLACGEADPMLSDPDPVTEPDDPGEATDPATEPELPDGSIDPSLTDEVTTAVTDAASRTGVDAADVEVVLAEQVEWSDGSLGCPEPDMMYTQALVPGYRVVVTADGETLHYHGADGQDPAYCADPAGG